MDVIVNKMVEKNVQNINKQETLTAVYLFTLIIENLFDVLH